MCLIITNSASYLSQLLFKLFFTVTQPDQSSVNLSLFLSLVCVRAHKSKADACPLRSSAQQVDSEDGASLSLSLSHSTPGGRNATGSERERERVCGRDWEMDRWLKKERKMREMLTATVHIKQRENILDFSYFVLFVPSKRCWCDEQGGGRDWHH